MTNDTLSTISPQLGARLGGERRSLIRRLVVVDGSAPLGLWLMAAALCIAVGIVHIQDQGGFLGNVTPVWIAVGYYAVEIVAGVTALLLARQHILGWALGLFVSAGPAVGYLLSRTVGLPGDSGDIGNWGYTLGTVSLIVEGALFAGCVVGLLRARQAFAEGRG